MERGNDVSRLARTMAFVMSFLLVMGCGLGISNEDNDDAARQENWRQLKAEYDKVSGTYEGTVNYTVLSGKNNAYRGRVTLNTFTGFEGRNREGKPIQQPQLIGRFRLKNIVQNIDYKDFEVYYEPQNQGEVLMVYEPTQGDSLAAEPTNIVGKIKGSGPDKKIKGRIIQSNATIAHFELMYTGPAVSAADEKEERFNRLKAMYKPLTGVYTNDYGPNGQSWACPLESTSSFSSCNYEEGGRGWEVQISMRPEIVDSLNGRIRLMTLYGRVRYYYNDPANEDDKDEDDSPVNDEFFDITGPIEYSPFAHTMDFSGAELGRQAGEFTASGTLNNEVLEWEPINNKNGPWLRFRGFQSEEGSSL